MELEATLALFQSSPPVSEPASPPPVVPELEQRLSHSVWVPGPEPQTAGPSAGMRIFSPAVQVDTEPTPAPEASCHPKNQPNGEKPDLLDFPPKLVAEQLTYMDAVSSWALGAELGQAFLLLSAALYLPFPEVNSYDMGPHLSSPLTNHGNPSGS